MKKTIAILLLILCRGVLSFAQQQPAAPAPKQNPRPDLRKGNELYKQQKYKEAQTSYMAALQKDPSSFTGMYNVGDALYNDKQYENARQALTASIKATKDKKEQASAYHNIGNTYLKDKKWEEAANAYKQSLRLDPTDADTKYNLAYANAMIKKDGGNNNKNNKDNKDNKNNKDKKDNKDGKDKDDKNKDNKGQDKKDDKQDKDQQNKDGNGDKDDKKDDQHPQGQPSKLTKQQADNILNALQQEEKKLQDKKEKAKGVPVKLDKDW